MRLLLAWFFLIFPIVSAQAQNLHIDGITIVNYGIYSAADPIESLDAPETATGHIATFKNFKLVTQTDTVPGRKGVRFGVEYVVNGTPKSKTVSITWITRFPRSLRLASGQILAFNKIERAVSIGTRNYRVFSFDDDWEIAAGDWTLEFYYQDRKVGEKRFTVVLP